MGPPISLAAPDVPRARAARLRSWRARRCSQAPRMPRRARCGSWRCTRTPRPRPRRAGWTPRSAAPPTTASPPRPARCWRPGAWRAARPACAACCRCAVARCPPARCAQAACTGAGGAPVCACRAEACWGRCCPPGVSAPAPVLLCVRACAVPGAHPAVRALRPHDGARTRSGRARRRWLSWRRGRSHARSAPRSGWSPRRCTACWARPRRRRRPWPACT